VSSGIIIDIDPVLVTLGSFTIRWYGVMMSLAILAGVALALRRARAAGIGEDDALYVILWALPSAFVGARLLHVIDAWQYYTTYPLQILAIQEGGLAIYGGLLGGVAGGALAARRKGLLSWKALDVAAPAMILGQAIGRLGCFMNGEHQGHPTDLPWATSYIHPGSMAPDSLPRHPAQMYEFFFDLVILGLLLLLGRRVRRDGVIFTLYAALYSFGRFWISTVREDAPFLLGFNEAQVVSVVIFLVAFPALIVLWRRGSRAVTPEASEQARS
jgi:phosphatidylglycerol---prolipoprotein diacylglyceryl transferase